MGWVLISEEYISDDINLIKMSFHKDISNKKYTPSKRFLETAYHFLNKRLFKGKLTDDIEFKIETDLEDRASGHTSAEKNDDTGKIKVCFVSLNGTLMRTVHEWLESILHEMIHVYDFEFHTEHFDGRKYDEHKDWFEGFARRFRKDGFVVKTKLSIDDVEASIDDAGVKDKHGKSVFLKIGRNPIFNTISLVKVSASDKDIALVHLKKLGCKKITVMNTDNLNSTMLDDISIKDLRNVSYQVDDAFNRKYGPFEDVETIDLEQLTFDESSLRIEYESDSSTMVVWTDDHGIMHFRT